MDKKSFILFYDYKKIFDALSDEEAGRLIKGIFGYVDDGTIPDLGACGNMAFLIIQAGLDRNRIKWEETKQKRSLAGKKGMEIRWKSGRKQQRPDLPAI